MLSRVLSAQNSKYKSQCPAHSQYAVKVAIIVVSFEKSAQLPAAVLPDGLYMGSLPPSPQEGEGYATLLFSSPALKACSVGSVFAVEGVS